MKIKLAPIPPRPEFIRLPSEGEYCPYTGFSRTGLYRLTVPCKANGFKPAVPAKGLRQPGNLRGIWLIPYERLIAYINALPTPGADLSGPMEGASHEVTNEKRPAPSSHGAGAHGAISPTAKAAETKQSQRRSPARRAGK